MTGMAREVAAELDAVVAEKVMGCKVGRTNYWPSSWACHCPTVDFDRPHADGSERLHDYELKRYSADIAAAWEVVERLNERWFVKVESRGDHRQDGRHFARWSCSLWPGSVEVEAETAPLAICRAGLRASGHEWRF